MRSVCVIVLLFLALTGGRAANIALTTENGSTQVTVEGELEIEDIDAFKTKTAPLPSRTRVEFRSKGGNLLAGIHIGSLIRGKKFTTLVPDGAQCASACALAWLGGSQRFVGDRSRVGFHMVYASGRGGPVESGPGNAILGAYLNELGLSEKAILYVAHAVPTSMQWLRMEEAAEYGIAVAPWPSHLAPISDTNEAVIAGSAEESPERRAMDFVLGLSQLWSGPNAEILPSLEALYGDTVLYHGRSISRELVLLHKRRFAERWSQRTYKIRSGSLSAACSAAGKLCRVTGAWSWNFHDPKTTETSRGSASFVYDIVLQGEPQIASETSAVSEPPSAMSKPLVRVGRSLRQFLAELSKPPIRPKAPVTH